ncbi:MAG: hypothetical protein LAP38_08415 [Acidobacteriia bacterium]|nr:hypothetical protein [Terriglobia bacterium]
MLRLLALLSAGAMCCYPQAPDSLCRLAALTDEEWQLLEGGNVVSKALKPNHERELAVAGVARVRASRECFLERFRDIESFKKSPSVRQIGKLSAPSDAWDLAGLSLDPQDVEALRDCDIGSCKVKVPVRVIQRLACEPEGSARDYSARANSIFREELLTYLQSYRFQGDRALIRYRDKDGPLSLAEQFHSLLSGWSELNELAPEFSNLLARGSPPALENVEEFLYWSKEAFGLKPVISVTHVIIYQLPDRAWIASKQIYASHYFDASLAITLVVDDPADLSGHSIYLAYLNRSRIDLLGGILGGLRRSVVRGRLVGGMSRNLQQTVTKLESSCPTQTTSRGGLCGPVLARPSPQR